MFGFFFFFSPSFYHLVRSEYLGVRVYVMAFLFFFFFWEFSFGVLYLGGKMFLISPLDGFEIQIGPYGPTRLTRTVSWVCSLNVLHKKYSGPCELRLNLLGLRAVAGSHGSGWSKKKKKKKTGPLMLCHFLRWTLAFFISHPHHKSENASQNTPSPSPQNKIEMKRTSLIFTLLLLRFPAVFILLQSSVFSFCVYSSCFFGGFLSSYVTSTQNGKTIRNHKSKNFFFFQ